MSRWPMVALGELSEVVTKGTTPKTLGHSFTKNGVPFVRSEDVLGTAVNPGTVAHHISEETHRILRRSQLQPGDLLITIAGTTGRVGFVDTGTPAMNCNQAVSLVRLDPARIDVRYACHACQSSLIRQQLALQGTTATITNLSLKQIRELLVPLPPISEQRRIVDILNRANGIRRLRREAQEKARQIIPALFVKVFGDPQANPKGWPVSHLADLVSFVSGATPSKKEPRYWGGNVPWVSAKDMKAKTISSSADRVTADALASTNIKLIPENSLLVVVRGLILAHTVPIAINTVPLTINQDLKALRPGPMVETHFLQWAMQMMHGYLISQVSTAAHGTKKLDLDRIKSLPIPIPPLALQQSFASRVADIQAMIAQQERMASASERLVNSLMAEVFG